MSQSDPSKSHEDSMKLDIDGFWGGTEKRSRWARYRCWLKSNHEITKDVVQILLLIVGTTWAIGWALTTFEYENIIKPARETPQVVVGAFLEEVGRKDHEISVRVRVTAHNLSKTKVNVLSSYFNVKGYNIKVLSEKNDDTYASEIKRRLDEDQDRTKHHGKPQDTSISRYNDYNDDTSWKLIHSNNLLQDSWLNPGEEYSRSVIFYVPDNYDLLRLTFDLSAAKDSSHIVMKWDVDSKNGLYATPFLKSENCPQSKCDPVAFDFEKHPEQKDLVDKYGLMHTDSVLDLSLWRLLANPQEHQSSS